jgi:hypothetical protein
LKAEWWQAGGRFGTEQPFPSSREREKENEKKEKRTIEMRTLIEAVVTNYHSLTLAATVSTKPTEPCNWEKPRNTRNTRIKGMGEGLNQRSALTKR